MAFKKTKGKGGSGGFRSSTTGAFIHTSSVRSPHSSFGLPNGDRIATVRADIMNSALNRSPEKK